ncbi:MAG: 16S rRNA (uracil(1498)-N(3))-methyltransferase [Bacteroidetes bacterium]|nr:16S rRNA (uracil(1498)-N(3))-methyltransferase [Bacteroidota bacterium]
MQLFFTPDISKNNYILSPEESKHCIRVLRLKKGDTIYLTDGNGNLFSGILSDDNIRGCAIQIVSAQNEYGKKNYHLHIAIAPTKNIDRFEWFLEKATEIGINEITPLICEHSERRTVNTERLNKILVSALKQSLKAYLPELNQPVRFNNFIKEKRDSQKLIAWYDEKNLLMKETYNKGKDVVVLIGPEGDFSSGEIRMAREAGFVAVNLGNSRLRTETAGVVACHTINLLNE